MPNLPALLATSDQTVGAWRTDSAGATNLYLKIDEGIAGAVDTTDYITAPNDTNNSDYSYNLADTPADFGSVKTLSFQIRYRLSGAPPGSNKDTYGLQIRIMNGATVLAAADAAGTFSTAVAGTTTMPTAFTNTSVTAFAYVNPMASKTLWDGAVVTLRQTYTALSTADVHAVQVSTCEITGTYTYIGVVAHTIAKSTNSSSVNTSAIDTTSANLIVLALGWSSNTAENTISDSKSNSWTPLTLQDTTNANKLRFYYALPTGSLRGSSHTFSGSSVASSFPVIAVLALYGAQSLPFDVETGSGGSATAQTKATGSITPSGANEIVITVLGPDRLVSGVQVDSGITIADTTGSDGNSYAVSLGFIIQTTVGSVNATWTWVTTAASAAVIAAFKGAAVVGTLTATVQTYTLTRPNATLTKSTVLSATVAAYTLTLPNATLTRTQLPLTATVQTYTLTRPNATLTKSTAPTLLTNLLSYWKMNEASGDAIDSHAAITDNTLTDHGGVGSGTGILGNGRDFESTNSQYFSHTDNAALSMGDIDFTIQAWIKLESGPASGQSAGIVGKFQTANYDYVLYVYNDAGTLQLYFTVRNSGGGALVDVLASNFGAPALNTPYLLHAWHDSVNDLIGIAVNAGAANTTLTTGGVNDTTDEFTVGAYDVGVNNYYFDGIIDEVAIWKGRVLLPGDRTQLYNGGAGLPYPFSTAILTAAVQTYTLTRRNAELHPGAIVDSYDESHFNSSSAITNNQTDIGQVFTAGSNRRLTHVTFYLAKEGAPVGQVRADLYAITGTPNVNAVPTGSGLCSSADVFPAAFPVAPSAQWITFDFSAAAFTLIAGTSYGIVLHGAYVGTDDVRVGRDGDTPTHGGNYFAYDTGTGVWTPNSARDVVFAVYGNAVGPTLSATKQSYTLALKDATLTYSAAGYTLLDNYSETNQDASGVLISASSEQIGQVFQASVNATLRQAKFYLAKEGSPTNTLIAYLYDVTGTPNVDAIPVGSPMAVSDQVDPTPGTFPVFPTFGLVTFNFALPSVVLNAGAYYAIAVYGVYFTGNDVRVGRDGTSPTHGGNYVVSDGTTWTANATRDAIFYVYGDAAGVHVLNVVLAPYTLALKPATLTKSSALGATKQTYALALKPAALAIQRTLGATKQTYTLSLKPATITKAAALSATKQTYTLTLKPSTLTIQRSLTPTAAAYALSLKPATLTKIAGGARTVALPSIASTLRTADQLWVGGPIYPIAPDAFGTFITFAALPGWGPQAFYFSGPLGLPSIQSTFQPFQPRVQLIPGQTLGGAFIGSTLQVRVPAVSRTITLASIRTSGQVNAPIVTALVAHISVPFRPGTSKAADALSLVGGPGAVTTPFRASTFQPYPPTIHAVSVTITAPFRGSQSALYTPSVQSGAGVLLLPTIASKTRLFEFIVSAGGVFAITAFIPSHFVPHPPTLQAVAVTVRPPFIGSTLATHPPTNVVRVIFTNFIPSTLFLYAPVVRSHVLLPFIPPTVQFFPPYVARQVITVLIPSHAQVFAPALDQLRRAMVRCSQQLEFESCRKTLTLTKSC